MTKFELERECRCHLIMPPPPPPPAQASGGLDAYYSFNDGTAKDSSGHGYDGKWEGNANYGPGKRGKAAKFDGRSRIQVASFAGMAFGDHFSVSVFFKRLLLL